MSRPVFKSIVFHEEACLGEAEIFPAKDPNFRFPNSEIRISHFSPPSERCPPLSILQTISPFSVPCKLQSKSPSLNRLHSSCLEELKTAVVLLGDEELHLVAMQGKVEKFSGFWCCSVQHGLYSSCLGMLNLRCLAIVFDLDETLIVANTMKSFEDRIEFLQRRIACETDTLRVSGMKAELKRYLEDRTLLKQYSENDQVCDNGKLIKIQHEEVPPISSNQDPVVRPIIRLNERNIVLTRINPEVRDTSVLVRLRPAWDDLRSYLTARGRRRFEVYVCTMAERDYALEMWRLLDPEAHLISSKQLLDRVVCVKSGSRKSLLTVFHDGICHPKMAMVIDDRLKVWDDKDQARVHVVPAFTPYYAPQAEMANAVPVLCVARNVACNVRGGFFKEFDENLLRRISELCFEDELVNLPFAPDVSDYLMSEDAGVVLNGNTDLPVPEGMNGAEAEHRLNRLDQKYGVESSLQFVTNNPDLRHELSQQPALLSSSFVAPTSRTTIPSQKPGLLGASPRQVGPVQTEINPDMRRRLPILQSQVMQDHTVGPLLSRPPAQILAPSMQPSGQSSGGWFVVEEDISSGQLDRRPSGVVRESDLVPPDKHRASHNPHNQSPDIYVASDKAHYISLEKAEEACLGDGKWKQNHANSAQSFPDEDGVSLNRVAANSEEFHVEAGTTMPHLSTISIGVLQEIGRRCGSKVEFRSVVSSSKDLQFSVEVIFTGEKIGAGMGRTRREAQLQAAENALHYLANKYVAYVAPDSGTMHSDMDIPSSETENGFLMDIVSSSGLDELPEKDALTSTSNSEKFGLLEDSKRLSLIVSGIKELFMAEDLNIVFQDGPPVSMTLKKGEFYSEVQIAGQILGQGTGYSKDGAKLQAAEEALESLKTMLNQQSQKCSNSPR